jgi:hypothetical protein
MLGIVRCAMLLLARNGPLGLAIVARFHVAGTRAL